MKVIVMAGRRPGHPRFLSRCNEDVDARDKPGHDELYFIGCSS
jgi:hypothetical protein